MKKHWITVTFLIGLLIGGCAVTFAAPADAATRPPHVTVVWSPHPDDETLRLTSYTLFAKAQGDILILVAVTDGGASGTMSTLGLTSQQMMEKRRAEQDKAWAALTGGKGDIIRLGLPDGKVSATGIASGYDKVQNVAKAYNLPIEHYVAATATDAHIDHRTVANGVLKKGGATNTPVRFSLDPSLSGSGVTYVATDQTSAEAAHQAYDQVGIISVPELFDALHRNNHFSRVITPTPFYKSFTRHTTTRKW